MLADNSALEQKKSQEDGKMHNWRRQRSKSIDLGMIVEGLSRGDVPPEVVILVRSP